MITLENVLAALEMANKRIDNLEKINLDLANESFNKSNMIDYERVKNAELVAQVSLLRASMSDALKMHKAEVLTKDSWDFCFDEFEALLDATPAQCLLEVKAEAVKSFASFAYQQFENGDYHRVARAKFHQLNSGAQGQVVSIHNDAEYCGILGNSEQYANKIRGG